MTEEVKNINPKYQAKENTALPLSIKPIVELLRQHSVTVIWEQAFKCPCVDIPTGQPKPDCEYCHGQGWLYLHPRKIDMALQGDMNHFSLNPTGTDQLGTSHATPQITINGIEQGIKPGDRITVPGFTTNESYTFNVTQQRLNKGLFIPFKVESINEAFYIDDGLKQVADGDLTLNDNFVQINNDELLDKTITLSLEVTKRLYVVTLNKELRYQKYTKTRDKLIALGNEQGAESEQEQDNTVSKDNFPQIIKRDGAKIVVGKEQLYRIPPLLSLRRESLYFSNVDLVSNETDNNRVIQDPRVSAMNDFLGD